MGLFSFFWFFLFLELTPFTMAKDWAIIMCDQDNKLAYLESSNPKNIPFYKRYGFESLGTIQVNTSPSIFPMLRKPHKL
jgi:hypothetical protein